MLNRKIALALISTLALTGCFDFNKVVYTCENDKKVITSYTIPMEQDEKATVTVKFDGRKMTMTEAVSASGALYVSEDEGQTYKWHTKDHEASLSVISQDGHEDIILRDCNSL